MNTNKKNEMAHRAAQQLWCEASNDIPVKPGQELSPEDRADVVGKLRALADLIEVTPEKLIGLTVIAGTDEVDDGEPAIGYTQLMLGSTPSIAATYIALRDIGEDALGTVAKVKLMGMMQEVLGGDEQIESAEESTH